MGVYALWCGVHCATDCLVFSWGEFGMSGLASWTLYSCQGSFVILSISNFSTQFLASQPLRSVCIHKHGHLYDIICTY